MTNRIFRYFLLFFFCTPLTAIEAQPSIISQIQESKASIVSITSENLGFYKAPDDIHVIDSKTGRMATVNSIARAAYQRNGSGVVIHPSGIIVTNAHIIYKADRITVSFHDGTKVPAQVVKSINNLDIALLKVHPPFRLKTITIADSDKVELGDDVITVGSSPLLKEAISGGIVTGLGTNRSNWQHGKRRTDLIQTSFNVYKGDSGGPLFDTKGRLIGMMTASEDAADHSSFAVPSNKIKKYLEHIIAK